MSTPKPSWKEQQRELAKKSNLVRFHVPRKGIDPRKPGTVIHFTEGSYQRQADGSLKRITRTIDLPRPRMSSK